MTSSVVKSASPPTTYPISSVVPQENGSEDFVVDKALMADVFADGYLENSHMGETDPLTATRHLVMLLKHAQRRGYVRTSLDKTIKNYETLLEFHQQIKSCITTQKQPTPYRQIETIARTMGEKVLALTGGEFLTLPAGYTTEAGGHSMLLDVEKRSDGNFDLILYTTGDGLEYHENIQTEDKKRVSIFRKFKNIPRSVLFFSKSSHLSCLFFEGLIYIIIVKQERDFSAGFIYKSLLERFLPYLDARNTDWKAFTKPQGNGICPWKVVIKHLGHHLQQADYRLLKLLLERDLVSTFFERENHLTDSTSQNLLAIATQKLHREIARALKDGLITNKEAKEHQEKATHIQTTNNRYNSRKLLSKAIETMPSHRSNTNLLQDCKIALQNIKNSLFLPILQHKEIIPAQKIEIQCTAEQFDFQLKTVMSGLSNLGMTFYMWDSFLNKVPINSVEFWSSLPTTNRKAMLEDSFSFLDKYMELSVVQNGHVLIPHLNSILTLYIIIDQLACKIDKEQHPSKGVLEEFALFDPFIELDQEPFLHFTDQKDLRRFNELRSYFKPDSRRISRLDTLEEITNNSIEKNPLSRFFLQAVEGDKELSDFLAQYIKENDFVLHRRIRTSQNTKKVIRLALSPFLLTSFSSHLYYWYSAIYRMHFLFSNGLKIENGKEISLTKGCINSSMNGVIFIYKNWGGQEKYQAGFQKPSQELEAFLKQTYEQRIETPFSPIPHEVIALETDQSEKPFPKWSSTELYWSAAESGLYPFHLLSYGINYIEQYDQVEFQTHFWLQFYKPTKEGSSLILPASDDPALLGRIVELTEKGLHYFYHMQPKKKPKISTCLFFIRVAQRARGLFEVDAKNPIKIQYEKLIEAAHQHLKEWSQNKSFTKSELALIHLHLLFHYQTSGKKSALEDILPSWFVFKNTMMNPSLRLQFLEQLAERFVRDTLDQKCDNWDGIGNKIASALNIVTSGSTKWKFVFPYGLTTTGLTLDFSTGEISYFGIPIFCSHEEACLKQTSYQRLFGESTFEHYTILEELSYIYFDHPQYGQIRICQNNQKFHIQRNIKGRWHAYVEREELVVASKNSFPRSLIIGHHHWMPIDTKDSIVVTDIALKMVACLKLDGTLELEGSKNHIQRINTTDTEPFFSLFDRLDYQQIVYNSLQLPLEWRVCRYQSLHGKPLAFNYRGGNWEWNENSHFILSPEKKEGILGPLCNYFYLVHAKTGEEKIVVPLRPLDPGTTVAFSPTGSLEIEKSQQKIKAGEFEKEEKFTYLTYKVVNGAPMPTGLESGLFLAYLYLHQGDYNGYLDLLQTLSPVDNLSNQAFEIFEMILQYPDKYPNCFPTTHAMLLKTILQWTYHKNKTGKKPDDILPDATVSYYLKYLQYLHHIKPEHQLTQREEEKLLKLVPESSLLHNRKRVVFYQTSTHRYSIGKTPTPVHEMISTYEELDALMGIDITYTGGKDDTYFDHLHPFVADKLFFRKAWDALQSNQDSIEKLKFQLSLIHGFQKVSLNSPQVQDINRPTVDFLYGAAEATQKGVKLPYPAFFKGTEEAGSKPEEIQKVWVEQVCSLYFSNNKNKSSAIPSQTTFSLQETKLPIPSVVARQEDHLYLVTSPFTDQLGPILQNYFTPIPPSNCPLKTHEEIWNFKVPAHLKKYEKAIREEVAHVKESMRLGREALESEKKHTILREKIGDCLKFCKGKEDQVVAKIGELEKEILSQINAIPQEHLLQEQLLRGGNRKSRIEVKDLPGLFLLSSKAEFKKANGYLRDADIEEIFNQMGSWCYHLVILHSLDQIKTHLEQLSPAWDNLPERQHLIHKIMGEIMNEPKFPQEIAPESLVFAYRSRKIPRPDQIEDITIFNDVKRPPCLLQKMMGSGKTSVNAALWAFLSAARGILPVLVVHSSQLSKVKQGFKKFQWTCLGQQVFTLDFLREDLTTAKLEEIILELKEGLETKKLLIIRPEMLDVLDLQADLLLLRLMKLDDNDLHLIDEEEAFNKVELIQQSMDVFANSDALGDEVDLLLSDYQETNIPIGRVSEIPTERVDLARVIFTYLISEEIQIEGKSLREFIGLMINHQTSLEPLDYAEKVVPAVAKKLATTYFRSLKDKPHLHDSFARFIGKKIGVPVKKVRLKVLSEETLSGSEKLDLEFLKKLDELSQNPDISVKEEAHLISLSKHIMFNLLPAAFKLSPGRNFGRWRKQNSSFETPYKIIPYLGVDNPALTELGHHYDAVIKHFLTVLQQKIEPGELQLVADKMLLAANQQMRSEDIPFEKTDEFIGFEKMTGISLEEAKDSSKLEEATARINSDPVKKLDVEGECAALYATYYISRLNRTAQGLPKLFKKFHFMGGTPWNSDGYPQEVLKNTRYDRASEGKILQVMLDRGDDTHVYTPSDTSPKAVLDAIYAKHPDDFIQGLYDSGAIFRDSLGFAKAFNDFCEDHQLPFKGVLFFHQSRDAEHIDQFSALVRGFDNPIPIYGTNPHDVEAATHYKMSDFFIFLIGKHAAGTDLKLHSDHATVMTIDEGILTRTLEQTALRQRDFFSHQKVEFLIPLHVTRQLLGNGAKVADIIVSSVMNQGWRKADSLDRSYHNMIDQVFKDYARNVRQEVLSSKQTRQQKLAKLKPYYLAFNPFLQKKTVDNPVLQFADIEEEVSYISCLEKYGKDQLAILEESIRITKVKFGIPSLPPELHTKMSTAVDDILKKAIQHLNKFPDTVLQPLKGDKTQDRIDSDIYQERQVERQVDMELDRELQLELDEYEKLKGGSRRDEVVWDDDSAEKFLRIPSGTMSLNDSFKAILNYKGLFQYFDENILVTDNFRLSYNAPLPVFHRSQKPARQILIIEEPKLNFILLSSKEGVFFSRFLKNDYKRDKPLFSHVHLLHSSKKPLVYNPHRNIPNNHDFEKGIVLINLFDGAISQIDPLQFNLAEQWINESKTKEKQIYLKLRTAHRDFEKRLLYGDLMSESGAAPCYRSLARLHAEKPMSDPQLIRTITEAQIIFHFKKRDLDFITSAQVPYLNPKLIPYLSKKELIQEVPINQAWRLNNNQIPFATSKQIAVLLDKIGFLKKEQVRSFFLGTFEDGATTLKNVLNALLSEQIRWIQNPDLVPLLADANLQYLDSSLVSAISHTKYPHLGPTQIRYVPKENYAYLNDDQLEHLDDNQVATISDPTIIKRLKTKLDAIAPSCVHYVGVEKIHYLKKETLIQLINPIHLSKLKDYQIPFISPSQLGNSSDDTVIGLIRQYPRTLEKLALEKFVSLWKQAKMLPLSNIFKEHLGKITDPQLIKLLDLDDLNLINLTLIQDIPDNLVSALHSKEHIQQLPPGKVPFLPNVQLDKILLSQLALHLHVQGFLDRVDIARYASLLEKESLTSETLLLFLEAPNEQLRSCAIDRLQNWTDPTIIPSIGSEKIKYLHALVGSIPEARYNELNEDMVRRLPISKIHFLTNDQLEFLSDDQVGRIADVQLMNRLSEAQLANLSQLQLENLTRETVQKIRDPRFIQRLPTSKVPFLSQVQLPHITDPQLEYLSNDQLNATENAGLIHRLSPDFFHRLDSKQVHLLSSNQVRQIDTKPVIDKLDPLQITHLSTDHIHHLLDERYVNLDHHQIPYVHISKIHLLSLDQLDHISSSQLGQLYNPDSIQKLRGGMVKQLNFSQLLMIKPSQLSSVSTLQKVAYIVATLVLGILCAIIQLLVLPSFILAYRLQLTRDHLPLNFKVKQLQNLVVPE